MLYFLNYLFYINRNFCLLQFTFTCLPSHPLSFSFNFFPCSISWLYASFLTSNHLECEIPTISIIWDVLLLFTALFNISNFWTRFDLNISYQKGFLLCVIQTTYELTTEHAFIKCEKVMWCQIHSVVQLMYISLFQIYAFQSLESSGWTNCAKVLHIFIPNFLFCQKDTEMNNIFILCSSARIPLFSITMVRNSFRKLLILKWFRFFPGPVLADRSWWANVFPLAQDRVRLNCKDARSSFALLQKPCMHLLFFPVCTEHLYPPSQRARAASCA